MYGKVDMTSPAGYLLPYIVLYVVKELKHTKKKRRLLLKIHIQVRREGHRLHLVKTFYFVVGSTIEVFYLILFHSTLLFLLIQSPLKLVNLYHNYLVIRYPFCFIVFMFNIECYLIFLFDFFLDR